MRTHTLELVKGHAAGCLNLVVDRQVDPSATEPLATAVVQGSTFLQQHTSQCVQLELTLKSLGFSPTIVQRHS